MRRATGGLAAVAAIALLCAAQAAARAPTLRDAAGIHVLSERSLDSRLRALSVSTSALPGPANVRILLPSGYAKYPGSRFPVL